MLKFGNEPPPMPSSWPCMVDLLAAAVLSYTQDLKGSLGFSPKVVAAQVNLQLSHFKRGIWEWENFRFGIQVFRPFVGKTWLTV